MNLYKQPKNLDLTYKFIKKNKQKNIKKTLQEIQNLILNETKSPRLWYLYEYFFRLYPILNLPFFTKILHNDDRNMHVFKFLLSVSKIVDKKCLKRILEVSLRMNVRGSGVHYFGELFIGNYFICDYRGENLYTNIGYSHNLENDDLECNYLEKGLENYNLENVNLECKDTNNIKNINNLECNDTENIKNINNVINNDNLKCNDNIKCGVINNDGILILPNILPTILLLLKPNESALNILHNKRIFYIQKNKIYFKKKVFCKIRVDNQEFEFRGKEFEILNFEFVKIEFGNCYFYYFSKFNQIKIGESFFGKDEVFIDLEGVGSEQFRMVMK